MKTEGLTGAVLIVTAGWGIITLKWSGGSLLSIAGVLGSVK